MAAPKKAAGSGDGLALKVTVDADRASAEFKQARRQINARTKDGLVAAGEKVALPEARRRAIGLKVAGQSVASSLIVKATTRSAYLTTSMRGTKRAAVGLQEFGGTVRTVIKPKSKQALTVGDGVVASVSTPRKYSGKLFMTTAVQARQPEIAVTVRDEVLKAFEEFEVT